MKEYYRLLEAMIMTMVLAPMCLLGISYMQVLNINTMMRVFKDLSEVSKYYKYMNVDLQGLVKGYLFKLRKVMYS